MNYKRLMKQYRVDMIDATRRWVAIDSIYDEKTVTKKTPFGKGVDSALEYAAKLGERYGFEVDRCDGYATELTLGEGEQMVGIFAHADVVPVSGEWKFGPFNPTIEKGKMYGRGTSDDKGPAIAAIYAVKALKDAGLIRNYKVRIVIGGDEERGSGCLEHYFNAMKKPYPTYGFTPDSDFPLIYGEKGIINFYPTWKIKIPHVKSIHAGVVSNAVCDKAVVELDDANKFVEFLASKNVGHIVEENKVTVLGKSVHGSVPSEGDNAALKLFKYLGEFLNVKLLKDLGEKLNETSGKLFDGFRSTKLLGETTYCVGIADYEKDTLNLTINLRYPEEVKATELIKNFDDKFEAKSKIGEESPSLLYDPNSKLVKTLLKAYRKETLDLHKPLTTGGGTYAKHSRNTIAFGAVFPGINTHMHEPNEFIRIKDLIKASEIYARAIYMLGNLK